MYEKLVYNLLYFGTQMEIQFPVNTQQEEMFTVWRKGGIKFKNFRME
jgi:hypothetical protein